MALDPGTRLKSFAPNAQQANPGLVGYLASSSLADDVVQGIGSAMGGIQSWLDQRDSFAGMPGALSGLRLRAAGISDQAARGAALAIVNQFSQMPAETQQAYLNILRSQDPSKIEEGIANQTAALLAEQATGTGLTMEDGTLALSNADRSIAVLQALNELWPDLAVRIGTDEYQHQEWNEFKDGLLTEEMFKGSAVGEYIFEKSIGVRSAVKTIEAYRSGETEFRDALLQTTAQALQAPFDVTTAALGAGGRTVEGFTGTSVTESLGDVAEGATDLIGAGVNKVIVPIHGAFTGLKPGDPGYEESLARWQSGFAILAYVAVPAGASAVGRRLKIARQTPGKAAAAAALEQTLPGHPLTGPGSRGGPLGFASGLAEAPLRATIGGLNKLLVRFAKDPEEWWNSGIRGKRGRKVVEVFEAAQRAFPDDEAGQIGFVNERYRTGVWPDELAKALLEQPTAEGMKRAFVTYLTENPDPSAGLRSRLSATTARRLELERGDPIRTPSAPRPITERAQAFQQLKERISGGEDLRKASRERASEIVAERLERGDLAGIEEEAAALGYRIAETTGANKDRFPFTVEGPDGSRGLHLTRESALSTIAVLSDFEIARERLLDPGSVPDYRPDPDIYDPLLEYTGAEQAAEPPVFNYGAFSEKDLAAVNKWQAFADEFDEGGVSSSTGLNRKLREEAELAPGEKNWMKDLDEAIAKAPPLKTPAYYYRSVDEAPGDYPLGAVIHNPGFTSVSDIPERVHEFFHEPDFMLKIRLDEGQKGLDLPSVQGSAELEISEGEFLLPRNTTFRVVAIEPAPEGVSWSQNVVMEVVDPRTRRVGMGELSRQAREAQAARQQILGSPNRDAPTLAEVQAIVDEQVVSAEGLEVPAVHSSRGTWSDETAFFEQAVAEGRVERLESPMIDLSDSTPPDVRVREVPPLSEDDMLSLRAYVGDEDAVEFELSERGITFEEWAGEDGAALTERVTRIVDSQAAPLPEEVTTYRGQSAAELTNRVVGDTFTHDGISSVTTNRSTAGLYGEEPGAPVTVGQRDSRLFSFDSADPAEARAAVQQFIADHPEFTFGEAGEVTVVEGPNTGQTRGTVVYRETAQPSTTLLEVRLPEGARAFEPPASEQWGDEAQLLLPSGTQFRVVEVQDGVVTKVEVVATPGQGVAEDGIWRVTKPGQEFAPGEFSMDSYEYVYTRNGRVVSYREVRQRPNSDLQDVIATTAVDYQGHGLGSALLEAHWEDMGFGSLEQILPQVEHQTLSPSGAMLNKRALRRRIAQLEDAQRVIDDYDRLRSEHERLLLEEGDLTAKLGDPGLQQPMLRYPERSAVRGAIRAPITPLEHAVAFLSSNKFFDPLKLTDELTHDLSLHTAGSEGLPANWKQQNLDVMSRVLRRVHVDRKTTMRVLGEMNALETPGDFQAYVLTEVFGREGVVDKALPKRLDPELRKKIVEIEGYQDTSNAWFTEEVTDELGFVSAERRPVLGIRGRGGAWTALPSSPNEFSPTVKLPDIELLIEADSVLRRASNRLAQGGHGSRALRAAYEVPRYILQIATNLGKPAVMIFRIPAMAMRIQMEQALRVQAFGYRPWKGIPKGISIFPGGIPIPISKARALQGLFGPDGWQLLAPDPRFKGYMEPNASEAGMFFSEAGERSPTRVDQQETDIYRSGARSLGRKQLDGWIDRLQDSANNYLDQQIVRLGFDAPRVLEWLRSDERAIRYMELNQASRLEAAGVTELEWLEARAAYLEQQVTLGNPDFEEAVLRGELPDVRQPGVGRDILPNNRPVVDEYQELTARVKLLNDEIRYRNRNGFPEGEDINYDVSQNAVELAVLQNQRKLAMDMQRALREQYGELATARRTVKLSDRRHARRVLERRWREAEWEMPETLPVQKRTTIQGLDDGPFDHFLQTSRALSLALYKPFRALTWADTKGTRGSLFAQVYRARREELLRRGYQEAEATAWARAYAGEQTRDIMYDLTARTSAQRALKDIFWFAPAWQEIIYTWFVKAPSASYWPIGAVALTSKFLVGKEILREIGVVQETADGEEILVVPGIEAFVERVTGLKVPPVVFGKLEGLNLVTTGGGVPGLSSPAGFALGSAALKYGGFFKTLSDFFQPYGPESSIFPMPLTYAWELAFGEAPPWDFLSADLQKRRWDQSMDSGIQYAFAELQQAGVLPPRPEDYGILQEDGITWVLTPEQEQAYRAASREYLNRLLPLGKDYARGIAAVRLLGSTISPMSLYATDEDKEAWEGFFDSVIAPAGFGESGFSDKQKQLIDSFLRDHPESMAYSVFYSEYGEKERDLPFEESLDDAFYDDYLTGAKRVTAPRDYGLKLAAIASLRSYQEQTNVLLDAISPGRDPWVLLTNGFERMSALQAQKASWERYKYLNPEAAAVLARQRAAWVAQAEVPVQSFEAERLGNVIDYLKQLSPMLTGEDAFRPTELRALLGDLQEAFSEHSDEFGAPNTPTEKAMDWWFDNVLEPYIDKTEGLYALAQELDARGLNASSAYNQIREISNGAAPKYKGREVSSVEAVFFGNKTAAEQEGTVLKWQTRPMSWLSHFQFEKAWEGYGPETVEFFETVARFDEEFWQTINEQAIQPASDAYKSLQDKRFEILAGLAQQAGPETLAAFQLSEAAPAFRLQAGGFGRSNQTWQSTVTGASTITRALNAAGLSEKGNGELAVKMKATLYAAIEELRNRDEAYDALWVDLSNIMPLPNGVHREGALLYEAILFGNFYERIPYELASIGG